MNVLLIAIILGAIQGLTEFLPVSSSGHLAIFEKVFGLSLKNSLIFDVTTHFATLLSLVFVLRKKLFNNIKSEKLTFLKSFYPYFLATTPALFFGAVLSFSGLVEKIYKNNKLVSINMIITGLVFLLFAREKKLKENKITNKKIFTAGIFQALGILPGISRSGITTFGGIFSGLKKKDALKVSFNLFFPIVFLAVLKELFDFLKEFQNYSENLLPIISGSISAFVFGTISASFLLKFFEKIGLKPFGVYLIIFGTLTFLFV